MKVQLYICPTPGCDNYYGSSGMPADLEDRHTGPKTEDRHQVPLKDSRVGVAGMRHSRAECPTCRVQGKYVDRVLVTVDAPKPSAVETAAAA